MKQLIIYSTAILFLASCQQGQNYKTIRNKVLKEHDLVMVHSEMAMRNKMKLDTLIKNADSLIRANPASNTAQDTVVMHALRNKLVDADDQMSDWMQQFNAEKEGKSDAEAVKYFQDEKTKIQALDSLYQEVLQESDAFFQDLKSKKQ